VFPVYGYILGIYDTPHPLAGVAVGLWLNPSEDVADPAEHG